MNFIFRTQKINKNSFQINGKHIILGLRAYQPGEITDGALPLFMHMIRNEYPLVWDKFSKDYTDQGVVINSPIHTTCFNPTTLYHLFPQDAPDKTLSSWVPSNDPVPVSEGATSFISEVYYLQFQ